MFYLFYRKTRMLITITNMNSSTTTSTKVLNPNPEPRVQKLFLSSGNQPEQKKNLRNFNAWSLKGPQPKFQHHLPQSPPTTIQSRELLISFFRHWLSGKGNLEEKEKLSKSVSGYYKTKKEKKKWHRPLSHKLREGKTLVVRPLKKHFFMCVFPR